VGLQEGLKYGCVDGTAEGKIVGLTNGCLEGNDKGKFVGSRVGQVIG
jgi:hypothetical protein